MMIPITIQLDLLYIFCLIILYRNIKTGMKRGIANGGMMLALFFIGTYATNKFYMNDTMNNSITSGVARFLHKYVAFIDYDIFYGCIKWILTFILVSVIISFIYSNFIYPFLKNAVYSNDYSRMVDKFLGICAYGLKGLFICYIVIELCSSPYLFQGPIDKKVAYDSIEETVVSIIDDKKE